MTTPSDFRTEATAIAIIAAIQANAETEAEAVAALMNVLAAKLVELGLPPDRAGEHFVAAMHRGYAATVGMADVGDTRH